MISSGCRTKSPDKATAGRAAKGPAASISRADRRPPANAARRRSARAGVACVDWMLGVVIRARAGANTVARTYAHATTKPTLGPLPRDASFLCSFSSPRPYKHYRPRWRRLLRTCWRLVRATSKVGSRDRACSMLRIAFPSPTSVSCSFRSSFVLWPSHPHQASTARFDVIAVPPVARFLFTIVESMHIL